MTRAELDAEILAWIAEGVDSPADEERFIDRPAIEFLISHPPDVIIG